MNRGLRATQWNIVYITYLLMSQYKVCNFDKSFLQLKILVPMFAVTPAIYACNVKSSARLERIMSRMKRVSYLCQATRIKLRSLPTLLRPPSHLLLTRKVVPNRWMHATHSDFGSAQSVPLRYANASATESSKRDKRARCACGGKLILL